MFFIYFGVKCDLDMLLCDSPTCCFNALFKKKINQIFNRVQANSLSYGNTLTINNLDIIFQTYQTILVEILVQHESDEVNSDWFCCDYDVSVYETK